jgi:hypothetical protein
MKQSRRTFRAARHGVRVDRWQESSGALCERIGSWGTLCCKCTYRGEFAAYIFLPDSGGGRGSCNTGRILQILSRRTRGTQRGRGLVEVAQGRADTMLSFCSPWSSLFFKRVHLCLPISCHCTCQYNASTMSPMELFFQVTLNILGMSYQYLSYQYPDSINAEYCQLPASTLPISCQLSISCWQNPASILSVFSQRPASI